MSKVNDLTNQVFTHLTVLQRAESQLGRACWLVRCSCGKEFPIIGRSLLSGNTKSCGCQRGESGKHLTKHGLSKHPLYSTWKGMWTRVTNPNFHQYKDYGGRGITIDPRWKDFAMFLLDMGEKPSPELTLEREDNSKGYGPENCVWATRKAQNNNRRKLDGEH